MLSTILFLNIAALLLEKVYKYIINNYNFTLILKTTIPGWFFFQILPLNLILLVFLTFNIHIFERMLLTDQPPDQPLHPVLCPHDCLLLPGQHVLQGEGESGGWWSWNYLQAEVSGFRDWRSNESILSFNES